ncbi:MAG: hypothetical protein GZ089_11640 [Aromatoleum sp.]|nr:hypothetical protein [Aromatoleum sp.]
MTDEQRHARMLFDAALREMGAALHACPLPGETGRHLGCDRIEPTAPFAFFVVGVPAPGHRTPAATARA